MKFLQRIFLVFVCLALVSCSSVRENTSPPQAVKAELDLRDWDFEEGGSLPLAGDWAFYWQTLIPPEQIHNFTDPIYVEVPESWTGVEMDGEPLPPEGYATYALTVRLPGTQQVFGLFLEGQGTSYTLWIDGEMRAQNGQVGTNIQEMIPQNMPQVVYFQPEGETAEFVIQISNYNHRKGGFRNEIRLGLPEDIQTDFRNQWTTDVAVMGIYFALGFYHLFIFASRPKNLAPLYFMIWCFSTALRAGLTNQNVLLSYVPSLSWALALRLEYLTFYLVAPLYILFLHSLYPQDIHRWFVRATVGLGAAFSLGMVFISTMTLSFTSTVYQIVILVEIIYFLYVLWRILSWRREGAIFIGVASMIGISGVVIEILYLQNILPFGKGAPTYGFLGFIFAQAILLSTRFSKSFQRAESLSKELEMTNVHLRESERKYRTIFEDSKDLIFIATLDEQIEEVNPASEEILGITQDEMRTKNLLDFAVDPEDKTQIENMLFNHGSVKDYELKLRRKDGGTIDGLVSVTLRKDEDGDITGVQGRLHDISARKQAEAERVRALKFERMAFMDALTQVYNRRFFDEIAEKEIARANRSGTPLSIILFDIDNFKQINDTYGHLTGDKVLANLASLCQKNMRTMDIFARYGGEEFAILMPDTSQGLAKQTAERLRALVAETQLAKSGDTDLSITLSIGIVTLRKDGPFELQTLLAQADQAMYQSKQAGGNRVTVYENY